MKKTKFFAFMLAAVFASTTIVSCGDDDEEEPITVIPPVATQQNIAELAIASEQTDSLVVALTRAGLVSTFQQAGDYTVFAPNNQAFADFIAATPGINAISDIDETALSNILKYHVLASEVKAAALTETTIAPTLNTTGPGNSNVVLEVDVEGGVTINNNGAFVGSRVLTADIDASNGVVHIIDKLLSPPNVVQLAQADNRFDSLVVAVLRAGLATTLSDANSTFTVFAPTNQAFADYIAASSFNSISEIPVGALSDVLQYHVVSGANVRAADIQPGTVTTLNGDFTIDGTTITTTSNQSVSIIVTDVQGTNGVVHAVDKVLVN
jgi:transforming growth factor-beta-induced protein